MGIVDLVHTRKCYGLGISQARALTGGGIRCRGQCIALHIEMLTDLPDGDQSDLRAMNIGQSADHCPIRIDLCGVGCVHPMQENISNVDKRVFCQGFAIRIGKVLRLHRPLITVHTRCKDHGISNDHPLGVEDQVSGISNGISRIIKITGGNQSSVSVRNHQDPSVHRVARNRIHVRADGMRLGAQKVDQDVLTRRLTVSFKVFKILNRAGISSLAVIVKGRALLGIYVDCNRLLEHGIRTASLDGHFTAGNVNRGIDHNISAFFLCIVPCGIDIERSALYLHKVTGGYALLTNLIVSFHKAVHIHLHIVRAREIDAASADRSRIALYNGTGLIQARVCNADVTVDKTRMIGLGSDSNGEVNTILSADTKSSSVHAGNVSCHRARTNGNIAIILRGGNVDRSTVSVGCLVKGHRSAGHGVVSVGDREGTAVLRGGILRNGSAADDNVTVRDQRAASVGCGIIAQRAARNAEGTAGKISSAAVLGGYVLGDRST